MTDRVGRSRLIHRPSRYGAVWLTYRTRLVFWALLFGFGTVFAVVALHFIFTQNTTRRYAHPSAPLPLPMASYFSNEFDQKIEWSTIRTLNVLYPDKCEQLLTPGAIPRLESLTIYQPINDEHLIRICELYDLKSLTLYSLDKVTAEGFRRLKDEAHLEYLQIFGLNQLRDVASLDWPPNVRTLICDETRGISLSRLNEWQHLANLTCLSTRLVLLDPQQPKEQIEALRRFPRLKQLFVVDLPQTFPGADVIQAALPGVRVRPATFNPVRGQCAGWILVGAFMSVLLLSAQVTTQFMTPARLMIPRFAEYHINPVIALYLAIVFVTFHLYLLVGCHFLIATGLCGLPGFVMASIIRQGHRSAESHRNEIARFTHPTTIAASTIFPVMGIAGVVLIFASEVDWFLQGHFPWLTLLFFAGSIWGPFHIVKWLTGLRHQIEAAGCGTVPLSLFDAPGLIEWSTTTSIASANSNKKASIGFRWNDAKLETALRNLPKRKKSLPIALWKITGGAIHGRSQSLVLGGFSIVVVVLAQFPEWWSRYGQFAMTFLLQMLVASLFSIFAVKGRVPYEMELLRPQTRQEWVKLWHHGIGMEFARLLLAGAVICCAVLWSGQLGNWTAADVGLVALFTVGAAGILFAVGMWTFTTQSVVLDVLIGIAAFITSGMFFLPVVWRVQFHHWPDSGIVIATIVSLYALALTGIWQVRQRWQNWEVGQVA